MTRNLARRVVFETSRPNAHVLDQRAAVTREIIELTERVVVSVTPDWHNVSINWREVWTRMDGCKLKNGNTLMVPGLQSPAQAHLRHLFTLARQYGHGPRSMGGGS